MVRFWAGVGFGLGQFPFKSSFVLGKKISCGQVQSGIDLVIKFYYFTNFWKTYLSFTDKNLNFEML